MSASPDPGRFHGELLHRSEAAGFVLSESRYVPGTRIAKHTHARAYVSMLLDGDYVETYGGRSRTCRPSTVVFHPEGESHADHFLGRGGRLFRCEIEPAWLDRMRAFSRVVDAPSEFEGGAPAWLLARLYREFRAMDDLSPLVVEGLALEIVVEAARHVLRPEGPRPPRWLERVKESLRADPARDASLDALAREAGVHPLHLARTFRRYQKSTVGEYLRGVRVEQAARALSLSDAPLAEVAAGAGFSDQSHFTRTFKRQTGWTPAAFRRQFQTTMSRRFKTAPHHEW